MVLSPIRSLLFATRRRIHVEQQKLGMKHDKDESCGYYQRQHILGCSTMDYSLLSHISILTYSATTIAQWTFQMQLFTSWASTNIYAS